jgi:hypothetical protein
MGQSQIFDVMSGLPEAAQLRSCYDVARLQEDLDQFGSRAWGTQGTVVDVENLSVSTDSNWTCLALRSPGGASDRTDPGELPGGLKIILVENVNAGRRRGAGDLSCRRERFVPSSHHVVLTLEALA